MRKVYLPLIALLSISAASPERDVAWEIVDGLTTEVGPRLAATPAEAAAREWAVAKLKSLGLTNARVEPFKMPAWERGIETGTVNGQRISLAALGNSGATGPEGLSGPIVVLEDFDALKEIRPDVIKGQIVYVGHAMRRAQDGSSYGFYGALRRQGPSIAAKKGAAAILIRSIGTDGTRSPHAGGTTWEAGVTPIPAAAVSNVDADQIERLGRTAREKSGIFSFIPKVSLVLTPRFTGEQTSGNVIADIPGGDPKAGIVLAACHLDSWDLGTGAIDDGAGCGIITAAALEAAKAGKLRRTIRLLWAGAEEVGIFGGKAYFNAHKTEPHALVSESDFGADRVWRVDFTLPEVAAALKTRLIRLLARMGIHPGTQPAEGGADVGDLAKAGVPVIDLQQDGTRYFDLHHTPDDTLDKIDRVQLAQNVAAWSIMLREVANAPEDLMAGPRK